MKLCICLFVCHNGCRLLVSNLNTQMTKATNERPVKPGKPGKQPNSQLCAHRTRHRRSVNQAYNNKTDDQHTHVEGTRQTPAN